MQDKKPYEVIPEQENPIGKIFGESAVWLETITFNMLGKITDHYQGGAWEYRKYPNGGVAMVFPETDRVSIVAGNQSHVTTTVEAISYAAWLMALSGLCQNSYDVDSRLNQLAHDHFHAVRDGLLGRLNFVIDASATDGCRPATDEELLQFIQTQQFKHPEIQSILTILD